MLPVEHVELELILGLLELLMLQCSMLLETFQNLKQLDSTGLFAGNLSEIVMSWRKHTRYVPSKDKTENYFGSLLGTISSCTKFQKFAKIFERITINICANNYLGLFYLLVAS